MVQCVVGVMWVCGIGLTVVKRCNVWWVDEGLWEGVTVIKGWIVCWVSVGVGNCHQTL
jgi:hypothetical protein